MTASLEVPLQITFHDMPRSDALDAHIRQKAAKFEAFQPRITSCRVTVEEIGSTSSRAASSGSASTCAFPATPSSW